ncbi:MAG: WbqC family protein [Bacteroidales bacterium]|jgi:hypothetical protein
MTAISIHQPNYIPWLGYFYKIAISDTFVFLDDAQFSNHGMHNYHYIKLSNGSFRLKIPVKQSMGDKINEVTTKDELGWKEKHLKIIETNYKRTRFFDQVYNDFSELLKVPYSNIAKQNEAVIKFYCEKLGIKTKFVVASDLSITSTQEERILDICSALDGDLYYSGTGAKAYQKEENFTKRGIGLKYAEYKPFEYPQLWGEFQANVTIIDYLMNCGYDWDRVMKYQKSTN